MLYGRRDICEDPEAFHNSKGQVGNLKVAENYPERLSRTLNGRIAHVLPLQ